MLFLSLSLITIRLFVSKRCFILNLKRENISNFNLNTYEGSELLSSIAFIFQ